MTARKADGSPAAGADISVAVVDKAVLALAVDPQGPLFDRFYSKRMLSVRTATTLVINGDRLVARAQQGGKGGGGGGGGPAEIELRREFPDVAYWRASMQLDANGSAAIEVPFPDNLTTWVMDARASTDDTLLGEGRAEVVVSKELLLRPALPRFFVQGDRASIGATVQNNTGQPADVTVQLQVFGLVVTGNPPGHAPAPRGESSKVTWSVDVTGIPSQTGDPTEREAVVSVGASGRWAAGRRQDGAAGAALREPLTLWGRAGRWRRGTIGSSWCRCRRRRSAIVAS